MAGKRFSKNMIRRLAMSGDVANAYALGRTMQEKHTPFVNASAVQIYGDGTRLHTLKSGSYRRLYATGGSDLMPQAAHTVTPYSYRFIVDTNKQCWRLGADGAGGIDTTWQKVLPGIKIKAIRAEEQRAVLFLAENGVLYGAGGWDAAAPMVSAINSNADVFPPQQITPFADWVLITTKDRYVAVGLRQDGTLWGWGGPDHLWAAFGLEQPVRIYHTSPVQLNNDTDWIFVEMGSHAIYAVKKDGSVWMAGLRYYDGAFREFTAGFEQVTTITKKQIKDFFSSYPGKHPLGLGQMNTRLFLDGTQLRIFGRLVLAGHDVVENHLITDIPAAAVLPFEWSGVALLGAARILWAQATNGDVLGIGTLVAAGDTFPQIDVYPGPWIFFSSYSNSKAAIKQDGTLWGWGTNSGYQLGLASTVTNNTPTQISNRNKKTGELEFLSDWEWVHVGRFTVAKSKKHGIFFCGLLWLTEDFSNVYFPHLTPFDPKTPEWTTNPAYRTL